MSFLLPLDDEREALATLEDALALIDACEQQPQEEEVACISHVQPSKATRSRRNTTKKPAHRERVKAELQQLRHEAAALELWLTRMKMGRIYPGSAGTGNPANVEQSIVARSSHLMATSSHWMEVLVHEFQRRKLSETRNHKLKALLKRLAKAARSPDQALANRLTQEEVMLIYEPVEGIPQQPKQASGTIETLVDRLNYLELNLATLLERAGLASAESCLFHSQRKVDQTMGLVFECASNTPLPHSIAETNPVVLAIQKSPHTDTSVKTNPLYTSYRATFQLAGQRYDTSGIMRKIVKANEIIYVWTSASVLMDQGLILKEEGLTRICTPQTPSTSIESMPTGSQLQTWYVAYMPQCAPSSTGDAAMNCAGKMLRAHTNKMTTFMQELMEIMQDETQGNSLERVYAACTLAISEFDLVYS